MNIKENKIQYGLLLILLISIIINIGIFFNIPTQEDLRLQALEEAHTHNKENLLFIKRYEKILSFYYDRVEKENECIRLNSTAGTVVDCNLLFNK